MAEHPDVQRFRNALEGSSSDGVLTDDVVWHGAEDGADAPGVSVKEVYADGVHTVAWLERSANGRSLDQVEVFHLDGNGNVSEAWKMPTDAEIDEALASGWPQPEHRNLAVFETAEQTRGRNTFEPQDIANIEAFLREDVKWVLAATGGTLHMDVFATFADDAHAVSFVRLTADHPQYPDRHMDFKEVNLFHVDENGQAYEFWGIQDDPDEANSFWAP